MIQLYGRRWQIETYFKAAKQYLRFDKTQVQNYDL
ncbi:transposase [Ligilactobacillus agilis]|nr:transposase [Ligilactobacillus agilis]